MMKIWMPTFAPKEPYWLMCKSAPHQSAKKKTIPILLLADNVLCGNSARKVLTAQFKIQNINDLPSVWMSEPHRTKNYSGNESV